VTINPPEEKNDVVPPNVIFLEVLVLTL
jgi:hypothetical protein